MLRRGISSLCRPTTRLTTSRKPHTSISLGFRSFSAMPVSSSDTSKISLDFLDRLNLKCGNTENGILTSVPMTPGGAVHTMISPATGQEIGKVHFGNEDNYEARLRHGAGLDASAAWPP